MPDQKITDLTELTSPVGTDLVEVVSDPGGTPLNKKVTLTNLRNAIATPGGSDTQVQFNDGGAFGADSTFTFIKGTDTLGVNNVASQTGTALAIAATPPASGSGTAVSVTAGAATAPSGTPSGGAVTITGGAGVDGLNSPGGAVTIAGGAGGNPSGSVTIRGGHSSANSATSGSVTIAGGSPSAGSSTTAGSVTIKSGDVQNVSGTVTITTGSYPESYATAGTVITVKPATPTTSTAGSAEAGAGVLVEGGPGQAHNNLFGNDTGGAGGPLSVKSGAGGAALANGNTRTGGAGGQLSLTGGDGGSATGSSGTRNGGNGGAIVIATGSGGTGASANGSAGNLTLKTGGTDRLAIAGATGVWTVNGDVGTTGQVLTANSGAPPSWETPAAGTVTSVALTVPSLLSVSGSPVTSSGTLAVTWNGTQDRVPYFSAAGTLATSADLTFTGTNFTVGSGISSSISSVVLSSGAVFAGSTIQSLASMTATSLLGSGTTSTDGVVSESVAAATGGTPVQISPRVRLSGTGWDSDDSVSRTVSFFTETLPVTGATVSGLYKVGFIDPITSGITYPFTLTSAGVPTFLSPVPLTSGGTNASLTASNGGLIYSTATALAVLSAGSAGQIPRSGGAGAPTWSTATYPATAGSAGAFLRSDGTNFSASTLILPNAATAGDLLVASGSNTYGSQAPAALTRVNDTNVTLTLGGAPTTALINAASLTLGWSGTLAVSRGGIGASTFKSAGLSYQLSTNYSDATGTAGVDNTAQTVKTIVIPANTLTQVGDSLWLEVGFRPDTGTALTVTGTVNGVTVASFSSSTDATPLRRVFELEYIDSTHANLWWLTAGGVSTANLAGFDWTADQDFDWDQNNIANNHLVVYSMIGVVRPKHVSA